MTHPIKGGNYEVEDLDKASGLDLSQPQGALAEGQCGLGTGTHVEMGPEGGHSLQQGQPSQIT